jgi:hypothetical protein
MIIRGTRTRSHTARAVALLCLPVLLAAGPCGPIPGGRLSDDLQPATPAVDWTFTNDISTIQVETKPDAPYSVTTWCFTDGPNLYVPSHGAAKKPWVQNVVADRQVRLRIGDSIYEMQATRITDEGELRRIVPLLRSKYTMARWGMDDDPAKSPDTWFFHLTPRGAATS